MEAISQTPVKPDRHTALQCLLLDMLAGARQPDVPHMTGLTAEDWAQLQHLAHQHRLEPLLHDRCSASGECWPVPENVRLAWKAAFREAALDWLALTSLLERLDATLRAAGTPYAALKGAFLAQHAWPHPAHRPMRDIDILVPRADALAVFALLTANGFRLPPGSKPPGVALERDKHLPPLCDEKSGISVEIHVELIDPAVVASHVDITGFSAAALARRQTFGDPSGPCFLDPTDTLLHLIVHAALDHNFDNGPLLFGDLAHLVRAHPPDWQRFWKTAQTLEALRPCQLALAMAERHEGPLDIDWHDCTAPSLSDNIVASACLMTLTDFDQRRVTKFGAHWHALGWRERIKLVAARMLPARHVVEGFCRAQGKSPPFAVAYLWWAADRTIKSIREVRSSRTMQQTRSAADVLAWLSR